MTLKSLAYILYTSYASKHIKTYQETYAKSMRKVSRVYILYVRTSFFKQKPYIMYIFIYPFICIIITSYILYYIKSVFKMFFECTKLAQEVSRNSLEITI